MTTVQGEVHDSVEVSMQVDEGKHSATRDLSRIGVRRLSQRHQGWLCGAQRQSSVDCALLGPLAPTCTHVSRDRRTFTGRRPTAHCPTAHHLATHCPAAHLCEEPVNLLELHLHRLEISRRSRLCFRLCFCVSGCFRFSFFCSRCCCLLRCLFHGHRRSLFCSRSSCLFRSLSCCILCDCSRHLFCHLRSSIGGRAFGWSGDQDWNLDRRWELRFLFLLFKLFLVLKQLDVHVQDFLCVLLLLRVISQRHEVTIHLPRE
mmetsp:Transcript_47673/g.95176  ORF Transcript_47673/g.95176 Transcript_47673/m.95176 type:complete len:259 (+) Transcript_47673:258-1034(+)